MLITRTERRHFSPVHRSQPGFQPAVVDPGQVTRWLAAQGFEPNDVGELRKEVPTDAR